MMVLYDDLDRWGGFLLFRAVEHYGNSQYRCYVRYFEDLRNT